MIAPSHRSIARALALLALIACQAPTPHSALSTDAMHRDGAVATTTVGMWGNDDGWSLVEPLRLASVRPDAPELSGESGCPRAATRSRVHPLVARVEKVSAVTAEGGPRPG
jgi:hypothetical protein